MATMAIKSIAQTEYIPRTKRRQKRRYRGNDYNKLSIPETVDELCRDNKRLIKPWRTREEFESTFAWGLKYALDECTLSPFAEEFTNWDCVYFIGCDIAVKIGYSRNPIKRLGQLQTGSYKPLIPLGLLDGKGPVFEQNLHWLFRDYRLSGEWFLIADELEERLNKWRTWGAIACSE